MSRIVRAGHFFERESWIFGVAAVLIALFAVYLALPAAGIRTAPTETRIVAREPGVAYDVAAFCADPATKVTPDLFNYTEAAGASYTATRGTETITWRDSPPGANPIAAHYWIDAQGSQHQEAVEMTKPAAECFQKKAR